MKLEQEKTICINCKYHRKDGEYEHSCYANASEEIDNVTGSRKWIGIENCEDININEDCGDFEKLEDKEKIRSIYGIKMNIAVVGNRTGWTFEEFENKLNELNLFHTDTIIIGGAEGIGIFAQQYAKKYGNICIIIYPKPLTHSPQRYYQCNHEIACRCDILVAFNTKEHSDTTNTINYAHQLKKEVIEVTKGETFERKLTIQDGNKEE